MSQNFDFEGKMRFENSNVPKSVVAVYRLMSKVQKITEKNTVNNSTHPVQSLN